ncbi:MAG TPA: hypothetical protein PK812_08280 [Beijerinckiaceae bacterium]|nr:hypothetical protein [Beijerinckiaceae bacterium]
MQAHEIGDDRQSETGSGGAVVQGDTPAEYSFRLGRRQSGTFIAEFEACMGFPATIDGRNHGKKYFAAPGQPKRIVHQIFQNLPQMPYIRDQRLGANRRHVEPKPGAADERTRLAGNDKRVKARTDRAAMITGRRVIARGLDQVIGNRAQMYRRQPKSLHKAVLVRIQFGRVEQVRHRFDTAQRGSQFVGDVSDLRGGK